MRQRASKISIASDFRPVVFFVTVYVCAGLIANDRRANALQIYLSKPLTRAEYVFGKLAILMTFLALVTWLPAIVLLIVQIAFAGSFTFFRSNAFLFPAITLLTFIEIVLSSTTMLALSSLSKSSRYVAILYTAVIFFTQAIYGAGFNSNSRFYENATKLLGMTPTAFRAGGRDAAIRFAVGQCSPGAILVAATAKGVCAIEFGDDPDTLVRILQDRFPNARLIGADAAFEQLVARVVGVVEAPAQPVRKRRRSQA